MSKLGPIIDGTQVENAVISTLRLWMPSYLAEVAALTGKQRGDLPNFRSVNVVHEGDDWPDEQLPGLIVVAPGLSGTPERIGSQYRATWSIGCAAVVSAKDEASTDKLARLYAAAMRAALLQHPSLGGFATGIECDDERYDPLGGDESRTLAAGMISLGVQIDGVLDVYQGLREPLGDPNAEPGEWGRIESTSVVTKGPS